MYLSVFNDQVSVLAKKFFELDWNGLFKKRIGIRKTHHGSTHGKNPYICCFLPGTLGGAGEYKKGIFSISQNSFCAQLHKKYILNFTLKCFIILKSIMKKNKWFINMYHSLN